MTCCVCGSDDTAFHRPAREAEAFEDCDGATLHGRRLDTPASDAVPEAAWCLACWPRSS